MNIELTILRLSVQMASAAHAAGVGEINSQLAKSDILTERLAFVTSGDKGWPNPMDLGKTDAQLRRDRGDIVPFPPDPREPA